MFYPAIEMLDPLSLISCLSARKLSLSIPSVNTNLTRRPNGQSFNIAEQCQYSFIEILRIPMAMSHWKQYWHIYCNKLNDYWGGWAINVGMIIQLPHKSLIAQVIYGTLSISHLANTPRRDTAYPSVKYDKYLYIFILIYLYAAQS